MKKSTQFLWWKRSLLTLGAAAVMVISACSGPAQTPAASTSTPSTSQLAPSPAAPTAANRAATDPAPLNTKEPVSAIDVSRDKLHGLHIRYWFSGSLDYQKAVQRLINTYNASSPEGIWIEARYFGSFGGLMDELPASTTDNRPDVLLTYPVLTGDWEASGQQAVDLRPYLQDPVWGLSSSDLQSLPAALSSGGTGSLTSFPGYREVSFLFYNQTWASELGFAGQIPSTPQQFLAQACAAAKANQKSKDSTKPGTGGWIAATTPGTVLSWVAAFGGQEPAAQGFSFRNDADQQAFLFLKGMFDSGCAWVARLPEPYDYFANRQALFFSGSQSDLSAVTAAMANEKSADQWTIIPYPGLDGKPVVFGDGPDEFLLQTTPERQLAAWAFLRWLSQASNQASLAEAAGILPARTLPSDQLTPGLKNNSIWKDMAAMAGAMRPMPTWPGWSTVGPMLGDAAGQLFQIYTKPEQIPSILDDLDKTIQEVNNHK